MSLMCVTAHNLRQPDSVCDPQRNEPNASIIVYDIGFTALPIKMATFLKTALAPQVTLSVSRDLGRSDKNSSEVVYPGKAEEGSSDHLIRTNGKQITFMVIEDPYTMTRLFNDDLNL